MRNLAFMLLMAMASMAYGATLYTGPSATNLGDGSDEDNLLVWTGLDAATAPGDTVYIIGMDWTITKPETVWPAGLNYLASTLTWFSPNTITVTLDANYPISRSANGDLFIDGPITINSVSPAWDGTMNGIQVNPVPSQFGLDTRTHWVGASFYNAAYNLAVTPGLPATVNPLSSVIFCDSNDAKWDKVYYPVLGAKLSNYGLLDTAVVLTVVDTLPDANSFRPGYVNYSGKAVEYTSDDIDLSFLPTKDVDGWSIYRSSYPRPNLQDYSLLRMLERVWLDYTGGGWTARQNTAKSNQPDYGVYHGMQMGAVLLGLCGPASDYKDDLAIRAVQLGLDEIAVTKAVSDSNIWGEAEGHVGFRMGIMLFAAKALYAKDPNLMAYLATIGPDMPDFLQTYYVDADDVNDTPYVLNFGGGSYSYSTGTVTVQNGSTTVEGSGVSWSAFSDTMFFGVVGDNRASDPFSRVYTVASRTDSDTIVLSEAYDGSNASGQTYKLSDTVYYGHGKPDKQDQPSGDEDPPGYSYFDYGEYVTSMIGLPDWTGWQGDEYRYMRGPNFGNPGLLNGTYRFSATSCWGPNLLALYLMDLSDELATISGSSSQMNYFDRSIEYCESQLAQGQTSYDAGNRYTWFYPMCYWDEWVALRTDPLCPAVWTHKPASPAPSDQASGVPTTPTLTWVQTTGTYGVKLYFGTTPNLTVTDYIGIETDSSYTPAALSPSTNYYWRVDYYDTAGLTVTGDTWSFSTSQNLTPGLPTITAPTDGATGQALTVTLEWSAAVNATTYDVWFGTDNEFDAGDLYSDDLAATSVEVTGLATNTTYYWMVAGNGSGLQGPPAEASFTTYNPSERKVLVTK
jgi:hypothetical protein